MIQFMSVRILNIQNIKIKNFKCILEKKLLDITNQIKETENKMFVYNFNHYFTKSLQI